MARVRVYELARELGVSASQVLASAKQLGASPRSASSPLEPDEVRRLRETFGMRGTDPRPSLRNRGPNPFEPPSGVRPPPRPGRPYDDDPWHEVPSQDDELTAKQASHELGVSAGAVRQWVHRGYLRAVGVRGRAHLYRRGDLKSARREAERNTRQPPAPFLVRPALTRRSVSTAEAASLAGVLPSTIRVWVHRGLLRPLEAPGHAHRFDPMQVLRVARRHPRRGG